MLSLPKVYVAVLAICAVHCQEGSSLGTTLIWKVVSAQAVSTEPALPSATELGSTPFDAEEMREAQHRILDMFYHGYDSYITYAFPHDELKPLTKTYTDSLGELGNLNKEYLNNSYSGVAMTLIDSLSTLAVIGNYSEFAKNVHWISKHLSFDIDVRVNVFEANIRLLGGLLSAHLLAEDPSFGAVPGYQGDLLDLAYELGLRLLPAFLESPTGLPYAWVNLKNGVVEEARSVLETNTAAVGSFTIEMTVLSRLTGVPVFEEAARRSLRKLWSMRSRLGLFGTALNMSSAEWIPPTYGTIGASSDSFYEYLLKAFVLFGDEEYWEMFREAYVSALRHYRRDGWYQDTDIFSGQPQNFQFTSLQGFWPGMQVMVGDVAASRKTFERFFSVVQQYKLPPERYLFHMGQVHPTEHYYPLRPELLESAYYLYQATRDPYLQRAGQFMLDSLYKYAWVEGGLASIRSVNSMEQEDYMPSFFLAETCKYLFLLFNDTLRHGNYVLTTEGHPIPVALVRETRPHRSPRRRTAATLMSHPAYGGLNAPLAVRIASGTTIFPEGVPAGRCPASNSTRRPNPKRPQGGGATGSAPSFNAGQASMPSCRGIPLAKEQPVQGLNLNAMLAALGEMLGSGTAKPGAQPLVRVVVDGLGQDGELLQMFGGGQAPGSTPGDRTFDGAPGIDDREGYQREEVGEMARVDESLGVGTGEHESLGVGTGEHESLGVGTHEHESLGVGTHEHESLGVGTHEDQSLGVGTHEVESLEGPPARSESRTYVHMDGLQIEMVFGGSLEGLVSGDHGLDDASGAIAREQGEDTVSMVRAGKAEEGGSWGGNERGEVSSPGGDTRCEENHGNPEEGSQGGNEEERGDLVPCVTPAAVPWYPDWGLLSSGVSALEARVCPVPGVPDVESLCHVLDRWPDHSCHRDHDCGIDGDTCRRRRCTRFNFCQA